MLEPLVPRDHGAADPFGPPEELVHDLDSQKENLTAEEMQTLRDLRLVKLLASAQRDRKGPKEQIDKETLRRFVTEDLSISETHRVEEILKSDPAQLDAYLAARLEDVGDRSPKPDEYLLRRVRAEFLGGAQEHAEAPNGSFGNRAKAMFEWLGLGTTGRQVAFAAAAAVLLVMTSVGLFIKNPFSPASVSPLVVSVIKMNGCVEVLS